MIRLLAAITGASSRIGDGPARTLSPAGHPLSLFARTAREP
jgi:NADP-dependent 3-hydroxy acid dehydrogenase YdfG